jgi:Fe-S-cluster containining protein
MAEAARRGGAWIACRPGCCECCIGPFSISQPDAARLREGMAQLDDAAAQRVRKRAEKYAAAIRSFDQDGLPENMDEVACPALDPDMRTCDLYDARPITCRTFGPAVKTADGAVATCELCFAGASEEQIAACAVEIGRGALELDAPASTFVAFALLTI